MSERYSHFLDRIQRFQDPKQITVFNNLTVDFGFLGLGSQIESYHHLKQVHGSQVRPADCDTAGTFTGSRPEADGLISQTINQSIAVKTADCLPILIAACKAQQTIAVGCIHVGWRGLVQGIIASAVKQLQQLGAEQTFWALGPCISKPRYEVGPEVIDHLLASPIVLTAEQQQHCYDKGPNDRYYLDLTQAACMQISTFHVKPEHINIVDSCTYDNKQLWNSHRRMGLQRGNNVSFIQKSFCETASC